LRLQSSHYKLSASLENFDAKKNILIWTLDNTQIDPNNTELQNGSNKIILSVYDKNTEELLVAKNINVQVNVPIPYVENIYINAGTGQDDFYSFTSKLGKFDNTKYRLEWILNNIILENPQKAIVKDGLNKVQLNIINRYTNKIIDTSDTDFIANKEDIVYQDVTYFVPLKATSSREDMIKLFKQKTAGATAQIAKVEAVSENKIKFICNPGYHITKEMHNLARGEKLELENYNDWNVVWLAYGECDNNWANIKYSYNDFEGSVTGVGCLKN
jgi:hypothetical protein